MTRPYRVALLQLRAHDLADHRQAWEELLRRLDQALAEGPELVVLPAAAYPAGVLPDREAYDHAGVMPDSEVLEALGERARQAGCSIAAGLVLRGFGGAPRHAAVLVTRSGLVSARATEASPASWFTPGDGPVPVAATSYPALLVAGNDLRDPTRAALMAETGARLVIHCGAATSWGADADHPATSDAEALLAARAVEGGTWVITAGKVGVEAGAVLYDGGAGIVDPAGNWLIRAPADSPGVVIHDIDLDEAPGAPVDVRSDLFEEANEPAERSQHLGVAAIAIDPLPSAVELMEHLRRLAGVAVACGARLVVLPDLAGADAHAMTQLETLPLLEGLSSDLEAVVIVGLAERSGGPTYKTVYAIDGGKVVGAQRQLHLTADERKAGFTAGGDPPRAIDTSAGLIGAIGSADALVPPTAAALRRSGAALLTWCAGGSAAAVEPIALARAFEAGAPVVAAAGTSAAGGAVVADASATLIARSPTGYTMVAHAVVRLEGRSRPSEV